MIINTVAILLMLLIASDKSKEIALAAVFLILLESITSLNNAFQVIYYNWQMIIYSYIACAFYLLARNSLFASSKAYIFYIAAYFIFALENTLYEFDATISYGIFDANYVTIMWACLAILVGAVIHDKLFTSKLGHARAYYNLL